MPLIVGRPVFISFQTAAETVHSGLDLVGIYARLRVECERAGHALSQRVHDADRRVTATAIRLGIPLVPNDAVFRDAPGLVLEAAPAA
ncbi:MAG: hypothetical protein M0Z42_21150 [Actinomycetota bacterium]|nr:hypothetical protein [Actinomycetota bacterium]